MQRDRSLEAADFAGETSDLMQCRLLFMTWKKLGCSL